MKQRHSVVVNDVAVLIAWIVLVSGLKCKGSVDKVKVQVVEPESLETRLECRGDAFGPMVGVPQLRGDKNILACDPSSRKS